MKRLKNLGRKALQHSAGRLESALAQARTLKGELKQLLDTPIEPVRFEVSEDSLPTPADDPPVVLGDATLPAQVYGRESCPWTGRARALLEREGAEFEFIDLDKPTNHAFISVLVVETKQNTNPYIFLRGRFIGGFNALDEIQRLGQLASYMAGSGKQAAPGSSIRIEVAEREDQGARPPGED
jgi:glutaredoxin